MQERILKLQTLFRKNKYEVKKYPVLQLSGKWLKDHGFEADKKVAITVKQKRIVITPINY